MQRNLSGDLSASTRSRCIWDHVDHYLVCNLGILVWPTPDSHTLQQKSMVNPVQESNKNVVWLLKPIPKIPKVAPEPSKYGLNTKWIYLYCLELLGKKDAFIYRHLEWQPFAPRRLAVYVLRLWGLRWQGDSGVACNRSHFVLTLPVRTITSYHLLPIQYHMTVLIVNVPFSGIGVGTLTMLTLDTNHPCKATSETKKGSKRNESNLKCWWMIFRIIGRNMPSTMSCRFFSQCLLFG